MLYKRVLLKITGEALSGENQSGLNKDSVKNTAEQIVNASKTGVQIAVVVGGGNILRGASLNLMPGFDRSGADQMGILATIINAIALKEAVKALGQKAEVLASIDMPKICDTFNKSRAVKLMEEGNVVFLGGGTGNPYFTTDTTAVLRALEINADIVLKATKVDGVYNDDPKKNPSAVKYETLTYDLALSKELKIMDATAFTMARDNNINTVVFNFLENGHLSRLLSNQKTGSTITK